MKLHSDYHDSKNANLFPQDFFCTSFLHCAISCPCNPVQDFLLLTDEEDDDDGDVTLFAEDVAIAFNVF